MAPKRRFRWEIIEQAVPAGNVAGGEYFPRWLVGDGEALVAALKREKATGVNERSPAGGERLGYI
jgi:hypothetical protein